MAILVKFFLICCIFSSMSQGMTADSLGKCECGAFYEKDGFNNSQLTTKQTIDTSCNQSGRQDCEQFCTALANYIIIETPEMLCDYKPFASSLEVLLFSKVCDEPWTFANVTTNHPMCCSDGYLVDCATIKLYFKRFYQDILNLLLLVLAIIGLLLITTYYQFSRYGRLPRCIIGCW